MTSEERVAMMWGASAGVIPALGKILAIDPGDLFSEFQFLVFLGHCVIIAILALCGAIVVRLNKETNAQKAFQLGIMAPAILVGAQSTVTLNETNEALAVAQQQLQQHQINSRNADDALQVPDARLPSPTVPTTSSDTRVFDLFFPKLYAQELGKKGDIRESGAFDAFLKGVTGSSSNNWFVIAGSYRIRENAEKEKKAWEERGWKAAVGDEPARFNGYYPVLIGTNLTQAEALAIRDQAHDAGFTDVWAARR